MLLKFNNIRDLSDARYAAANMAEWIGFSVGESDSLPVGKIQEIIGWCAGPKLILELAPGISDSAVLSYLDVLPVDGLEMQETDFKRLKPYLPESLIIILKSHPGESANGLIFHAENTFAENCICRIRIPGTEMGPWHIKKPWAISIDCFDTDDPALKNYDVWNAFFDTLENEGI